MQKHSSNQMIKNILIVGGGTAGWMAAALLSKLTMGAYNIALIESDEIGVIGVGEATIPAIKIFNNFLEIDEAEMMRKTNATFKLGIEFVNWRDLGHSYVHGFGKIGQDLLWLRTHQFWLKAAQEGRAGSFDNFSIATMAARQNKFDQGANAPNSPIGDIDYAYQFDAILYGKYLRSLCEERGVRRIEGKITEVKLRPLDGFIDKVIMQNGNEISADLFIDCSGQHALLIGGALGEEFEDWSNWLLCDRAIAVPCENAEILTPYTRSTAREAGWQWRIPLLHRIGNGHVYSSQFMSDDAANDILIKNLDGKILADPRKIKFKPGKRAKTFVKNCVAIGLSSGFLEPLESTSIHLIQTGLLRLLALFPAVGFNQTDIDEYNNQTEREYRDIRNFIIAHYKVTNREDTPFWAYCKNMDIPEHLNARLELFKSSARFFKRDEELFREESWIQVLLGQGLEMNADPMVNLIPKDQRDAFLHDIEEVIADCVKAMPTHQSYIDRFCKA